MKPTVVTMTRTMKTRSDTAVQVISDIRKALAKDRRKTANVSKIESGDPRSRISNSDSVTS
jgi:hypothetical protein